MATDNVVLNKTATMERCISRVLEEYQGFEMELATNYTKQDSIILNLERICQAAIDLAAHLVRVKKLGIPQDNRELFQLLEQNGLISEKLSRNLQSMVGFRNLAVHDYQELNLEIIQSIIKTHLTDFQAFSKITLRLPK
jgi:uncharacterized protein YutE (UPF0331/DUF86 family)